MHRVLSRTAVARVRLALSTVRSAAIPAPAAPAVRAMASTPFPALDTFERRHLGPTDADAAKMLGVLGVSSLDELVAKTIPSDIRLTTERTLPAPASMFAVAGEPLSLSTANAFSPQPSRRSACASASLPA